MLLLCHLQLSSLRLSSFVLGVFLPFISQDLELSPLEAGLLQGVWWVTAAAAVLPFGVWFSRFRPVAVTRLSMWLVAPLPLAAGVCERLSDAVRGAIPRCAVSFADDCGATAAVSPVGGEAAVCADKRGRTVAA